MISAPAKSLAYNESRAMKISLADMKSFAIASRFAFGGNGLFAPSERSVGLTS
jgi:hypothetical protein